MFKPSPPGDGHLVHEVLIQRNLVTLCKALLTCRLKPIPFSSECQKGGKEVQIIKCHSVAYKDFNIILSLFVFMFTRVS